VDASKLASKVRDLCDKETLAASMSEEEGVRTSLEALEDVAEGYRMRLGELEDEWEDDECEEDEYDDEEAIIRFAKSLSDGR
jgi:hypothetical protein